MTEKITSKQETRLSDLFRDSVRGMELSKEDAQELIAKGGVMQAEIKTILTKLVEANKMFGSAIKEFEITVPAEYKHESQIDEFAKKTKKLKTTNYYNDELNSKNFAKVTNKLVPGKTYAVSIFPILKRVTSEDCMIFLRKQKAILVGGQGLTLAQSLKADEFPVGKYTVSFDEQEALWKDAVGYRRVPYASRSSDGDWSFVLGSFEFAWDSGLCLICFCDKKPSEA